MLRLFKTSLDRSASAPCILIPVSAEAGRAHSNGTRIDGCDDAATVDGCVMMMLGAGDDRIVLLLFWAGWG